MGHKCWQFFRPLQYANTEVSTFATCTLDMRDRTNRKTAVRKLCFCADFHTPRNHLLEQHDGTV